MCGAGSPTPRPLRPVWAPRILIFGWRAWICSANQLREILLAVAEQDDARLDLADEVQQVVAVGVGGEVEVLHLATAGHFARRWGSG